MFPPTAVGYYCLFLLPFLFLLSRFPVASRTSIDFCVFVETPDSSVRLCLTTMN